MDEYKKIILKALDYTNMLTKFEHQFINDLAGKIDDFELSPRQEQVLDRIEAKIS